MRRARTRRVRLAQAIHARVGLPPSCRYSLAMNEDEEERILLAHRIKQDLPNIPEDVVDTWLAPLATDPSYGWPPTMDTSSNWRYVLLRQDLDYWTNTTWRLTERTLNATELNPQSKHAALCICDSNVNGMKNEFSSIENSEERFSSILQHLASSGIIPRPIVMSETSDGLYTIDGNHRVSALFWLRDCWRDAASRRTLEEKGAVEPQTMQPVWICSPPSSTIL